jgi:hypothetical protein
MVLAIALDVLPADLGLVAAAEIGIAVLVISVVSKSVAITSIVIRLRFMEPPGPLATGVEANCEIAHFLRKGGFP